MSVGTKWVLWKFYENVAVVVCSNNSFNFFGTIFLWFQVGIVMIDEQQEKLSPDLQSLVESEVKRLIQVCILDFLSSQIRNIFHRIIILINLICCLHPVKACFMGVFWRKRRLAIFSTQPGITCSKLTVETLLWIMLKVNSEDTKTTPLASFWCLYC